MNALKASGILWLVGALFGISATVVFRTELVPWAATFIAGLAAVGLGVQFVRGRGTGLEAWSGVLGLAWAALYGVLAVAQVQDPYALLTDVGVGLIGAGAAVAGARSARRAA